MARSPITCHVLDATLGRPGRQISVRIERLDGTAPKLLARGETDKDGRCSTLLDPSYKLTPGIHRMVFETGSYFARDSRATFYPQVEIFFTINDPPDAHYHIPLLLSPHSYTTYRGS